MKNLTLKNIAQVCGGILHLPENASGMADEEISFITTDSRQAAEGCLFAAIRGERTDGHSYIPQVFEKGALCVLSEKDTGITGKAWIKVISTLQALKDLAEFYLQGLAVPVVGITGSVGKTSTKEMIASILSQKYNTLYTEGNYNNELGVPLTIFRLREYHQMAVIEMGISDFGEMHRLAKIARPDTCVITNIGQCHLEFLGDRDGVLRAKTEIFDFLDENAHIILNGNDDKLASVRLVNGIQPVFFGLPAPAGDDPELSVWADEIVPLRLEGISCRIHTPQGDFTARVPIPGNHMVMNALAGTAVGLTYGLTLDEIRAGIESLESVGGRMNMIQANGYMVIDDCYNANPMSMKASLGVLGSAGGRKVAVLGDMFELGPDELRLHAEVGRAAAEAGLDLLIGIGRRSLAMTQEAAKADPSLQILYFEKLEDFLPEMKSRGLFKAGDTILVKASHGMNFAGIVRELKEE